MFTPGPGTIIADPVFAGPGNYHLGLASPAVNAGNDADVPADVTTDLDGNPRILEARVDIGAFESSFASCVNPKDGDRVAYDPETGDYVLADGPTGAFASGIGRVATTGHGGRLLTDSTHQLVVRQNRPGCRFHGRLPNNTRVHGFQPAP